MKKYRGDLIGSNFLKELNRVGDCTFICGNCQHHNGECEDFARKGYCKLYDKYGNKERRGRQWELT